MRKVDKPTQISFRLSHELKNKLKQAALMSGFKQAEIIRRGIETEADNLIWMKKNI